MSQLAHDKPTKWYVRPEKTQISLGTRPVWSESSLSAWRKLGSLATHWAQSEVSNQTRRMPRLIWVSAGRTCHFAEFAVRWLKCVTIWCLIYMFAAFCLALYEAGAYCFAFRWFLTYKLDVEVCLFFLLMSLVDYVLWLWLFLDIVFFINFHPGKAPCTNFPITAFPIKIGKRRPGTITKHDGIFKITEVQTKKSYNGMTALERAAENYYIVFKLFLLARNLCCYSKLQIC